MFICFLLPFQTYAQDYYCYDKITSADGLSQGIANCIIQDSDGFIWIGTQNGLNQYDGFHFTYYLNQVSDSTSLSDNYVLSMCEDKDGNLWIGTMSGGLNKLDKRTGRFTSYMFDKNNPEGISDNSIWKVVADGTNNIWAVTRKGINVLNTETNRFRHYRFDENDSTSVSSDMVLSIFVDDTGEVWCGTADGLVKYNRNEDNFQRYNLSLSGQKYTSPKIWAITQGPEGNILFGSGKGLWEQDINNKNEFNLIHNSNNFSVIWCFLPLENNLWTGTKKGLWDFNSRDKSFTHIQNIFISPDQHEGNTWSLIKDKAGIIWSGSDEGIIKFRQQKGRFKNIKANSDNPLHLSHKSVNSVLVDKDKTLWVGTDGGGLDVLEKGATEFTVIRRNEPGPNTISGNRIWALMQDSEGLIWIGTYGAGLNSYNKKTGKFTNYSADMNNPEALSNSRVLALLEDSEGKIWIGTRGGGLNVFDKKTGKFKAFLHNPDDTTTISSNTILTLTEDMEGNILAGTYEGGFSIFNKKKNTFRNFKNDPSNPESISNNNVWGLLFDDNNRLWLATQGGLNFTDYDLPNLSFHHFETSSGLPGNFIFGLEEDNKGNIWISTFKGMARLNNDVFTELIKNNSDLSTYKNDPFNPLFKTFDESNGIAGNEFNQGAYFKSDDGTIFFGGMTGLTLFHPDSVKSSDFEPNVILSGFKIFNKEVGIIPADFKKETSPGEVVNIDGNYFIQKKITYLDELTISYRESVFSFDFAALDYTMPEKNRYAYKMENFDRDWNYVSEQNSATYTNLDAGEYVFRVRATNSDGKWSKNEARLAITITPPFWKTTWFVVLTVLIFIISLLYTVRRIIRKQKEKEKMERERIELQLKTIKNQIDPHFAFNAMNMIGSLVYKGNPDTVYDYFTRFANLIRSTLQDSEKVARPLSKELEFVKNYIEIQKTRFKDRFEFDLYVDKKVDLSIEIPKMIIQTHIENAIKHGLMHKKTKGKVSVKVVQENGRLLISIEDDGIGRKKAAILSKGSTGKGMQIIDKIFSLYNKLYNYKIEQQIIDLKDENGSAAGTRVEISISS